MTSFTNPRRRPSRPGAALAILSLLAAVALAGLAGASTPAGATGTTVTVHLIAASFTPGTVTIDVGDRVTWVNDDQVDHTVTADDGSFNSSPDCPDTCMGQGATYTHTFTKAGTFTYTCLIHGASMSGTVIVRAAPTTTTASLPGASSTSRDTTTTAPAAAAGADGVDGTPKLTG